ncbi:receptor kinase [Musa troglodytarum]|uniref:non-specific serine/threonine protein kinase n=1 Tax=Musa troglodytarum TaxID=320322 RepID=A0A9E7HRM8_9LILI|nr:receptor kinase [Musa troglodytarum]
MPAMLLKTWVLNLLLLHSSLAAGSHDFVFNGFRGSNLTLGGVASLTSGGLLMLTNNTKEKMGHAFYPSPLRFGDLPNGTVFSFSTTFVTAFISEYADFSSHGVAFVVSPTKDFSRALGSQYPGLFNRSNDGNSSNHVWAIELDTINNPEFQDIDDNHVGIDINSLTSMDSHTAGYYADDTGLFKSLRFSSGQAMQIWIDYDDYHAPDMLLNVTLAPIPMAKPRRPLLSAAINLSSVLLDLMYVGFSSSTGPWLTSHYVLGWSFKMNGVAQALDLSLLPSLPRAKSNHKLKVLRIGLPLASATLVLIIVGIVVFILRRRTKYSELLEDWELEYGPHRFSYKDLFHAAKGFRDTELLGMGGFGRVYKGVLPSSRSEYAELLEDWELEYGPRRFSYKDLFEATKGFRDKELLGMGGFGRVYKGVLQKSKAEVAVKRVSHESRQGMREFIAEVVSIGRLRHRNLVQLLGYCRRKGELLSEIAVKRVSHGSRQGMREFIAEIVSIGRLRHRNLVQLLGYCRRKGELLLVYDYMPNGSLDKFLYDQDKPTLDWATRFRIIKGVASGLLYLHEDWEQVVVHRDIKASNVLLDHEWNGRLGDFGLARLYDHGTDPLTTHVVGTTGYLAPELVRNGKATTVTDVFAFGAFVLEVACGRRPVDTMADEEQFVLLDWVVENWGRGSILETRDARLGEECVAEEVELVLKLGLLCSHPLPAARPSMRQVVRYLEGDAPLPELSPTYLSFSVLGLLQNKGFDDHIVSYPSSSVATASVISGISGEAAIVSTDSKHNPRLLVDGESIAEETTDTPKPRFLLASDRLLFSLMASNGSAGRTGGVESSLEKIKRQLMSGSGKYLLQGPLLKRSETLRKWNERWVILDPTTGKMEYNATQLVLHAHKEAVTNLSGSGSVKLGTIATVVATANSTAMEASKEIEAAMRISMKAALGLLTNKANEGQLDDFTIMKETIRVKDEELQQLAKDIRARDSTIKDITDKLIETAEAAEAAASAAHAIDEERRISCLEIEHLTNDAQKQLETAQLKLRESEEKVMALATERELLLKQRNSALQEAHLWRSELAKAREHAVILEAAVFRAEGRARALEVDAGTRVNDAVEKALAAAREKEDLLALVNVLQTQVQRQQSNTDGTTKHVDLSEDDVDKACLSDPRVLLDSADIEVQLGVDGVEIRSIGDAEWGNFQSAAARTADVREISLQSATPLVASLSVAAAAMGGRYLIQAWQAFKARPVVPRVRRFYPGGFEQQMTIREAALILGVREHAPLDKIKEAHRRVMVANHPDSGGSHYLASKINEAKDVSDIEEVKQKEM